MTGVGDAGRGARRSGRIGLRRVLAAGAALAHQVDEFTEAGAAAERWLQLMTAGEIDDSRALMTGDAAGQLVPRGEPGTAPRPVEELERIARERLEQDPLVRDFASVEDPQIEVETVSEPVFDAGRTMISAKLFLADQATGSHRHVQMQMSRNKFYESEGEPWRVDRWEASDAHAAH